MPDIELPEADPVYVISGPPTVPNLMFPPLTLPWMALVPLWLRLIVPTSCEPACFQFSVNVPVKVPLYWPDHFPESAPLLEDDDEAVVVGFAAAAGAELAFVAVDELLPLLPQPAATTAKAGRRMISNLRGECMSCLLAPM